MSKTSGGRTTASCVAFWRWQRPPPPACLLLVLVLLAPHRLIPHVRHDVAEAPAAASSRRRRLQGGEGWGVLPLCPARAGGRSSSRRLLRPLSRSVTGPITSRAASSRSLKPQGKAGRGHGPGRGDGRACLPIEVPRSPPITPKQLWSHGSRDWGPRARASAAQRGTGLSFGLLGAAGEQQHDAGVTAPLGGHCGRASLEAGQLSGARQQRTIPQLPRKSEYQLAVWQHLAERLGVGNCGDGGGAAAGGLAAPAGATKLQVRPVGSHWALCRRAWTPFAAFPRADRPAPSAPSRPATQAARCQLQGEGAGEAGGQAG